MVKVADTLEGVQSGIIDIGGFCFCFEPSNLPLHAFQVMLPFGTMDPVDEPQGRARRVRQGAVHVEGVRGQVPAEADRADRRQRLQPRHHDGVEQRLRPQGRQARRRRPQSEMAGVRRRGAGAGLAGRGLHRRCRPAFTTAGSCSRRATSTSSSTSSRQVLHRDRLRRDHLARPDHQLGALEPAAEGGAGHHPGSRQGVRGEDRHGEQGELSRSRSRS